MTGDQFRVHILRLINYERRNGSRSIRCPASAVAMALILICVLPGQAAGLPNPAAQSSGEAWYYRPASSRQPARIRADVAVYGGTPAGVTAAIQAARMGRKAVLLSFNRHVGGMTSGGLTATDVGNQASIGGLALEFYKRLGKLSGFRPSEAEALYLKLLDEAGVDVLFERCLESVVMRDGRLVSATMETGETVEAAVFIDATYEGDLMAAANVSYRVGRESAKTHGESAAGAWYMGAWLNVYQFCRLVIDPFVKKGDPASGLLPEIASEAPGAPGDGDGKVQSYNFRVFMTDRPERVPFPRPAGYDAGRYGLLARFLNLDPRIEWRLTYTVTPMTDGPVQLRNGDCNNAGSFSTDYVGGNYRWPDGTYQAGSSSGPVPERRGLKMPLRELYELRERIFQDHVAYQQGLYYFLANDPAVPGALRERVNRFGLDPREFTATGLWPHQLYVREARRMVSAYVMTQHDCESKTTVTDSAGLASYPMDSHFCQRVAVDENGRQTVRNEGGWTRSCPRPYPVSWRALVPRKAECANLIVPVCLSATHVAYGSIRMEPVFMILGQTAGTAAAMAVGEGIAVQDVDYDKLSRKLLADGQVLSWNVAAVKRGGIDAASLPGMVVDDADPGVKKIGPWQTGHVTTSYVNGGYSIAGPGDPGDMAVIYTLPVKTAGVYELRLSYPPNVNRSDKVTVEITHAGGTAIRIVNERKAPPLDGLFVALGAYRLEPGKPATVTIRNEGAQGYVIADAVQAIRQP